MEAKTNEAAARKRFSGSLIVGAIAVLFAAAVLVFALTAGNSVTPTSVAEGAAPVTNAQNAVSVADQSSQLIAAGSAVANNTAEVASAAAGETIADDETPLSAYPGKQVSSMFDTVTWLLLAGIAMAAIFFLLSTRRMNRDISHMRSSLR